MSIGKYLKAIAAAAGAGLTAAIALTSAGSIDWRTGWIPIATAVASALGVWAVPNKPASVQPPAPPQP